MNYIRQSLKFDSDKYDETTFIFSIFSLITLYVGTITVVFVVGLVC